MADCKSSDHVEWELADEDSQKPLYWTDHKVINPVEYKTHKEVEEEFAERRHTTKRPKRSH